VPNAHLTQVMLANIDLRKFWLSPSHRRRPVSSSLKTLDSGLRRN